ncbi:MAG: hypothetical protein IT329_17395 [Caldilineaceae bacterium]|nr:hypothetical protein [Caldilineaceae bacterium]
MKYLRYLLILMGLWIMLVSNMGNWLDAPALTPYAYLILAVSAALPILFPPVNRGSPFILFSAAILVLIGLRALGGYELDQRGLQVIAVEIVAIGVTILLATLAGAQINAVQGLFDSLGVSKLQQPVGAFDEGQHAIYREVRWARRYQRHLALLAISINADSLERMLGRQNRETLAHRLAKEAQSEIWHTYALNQLAKLLIDELGDNAIITRRREHFVVILAETGVEQVIPIVEQLRELSEAGLGLKLDIGVAVFPDEAVTFEALLQQAESLMAGTQPAPTPSPRAMAGEDASKPAVIVSNRQEIRAADEAIPSV